MEKNGRIIQDLNLCIYNDDVDTLKKTLNEIKREKVETYAQEIIRALINSVPLSVRNQLEKDKVLRVEKIKDQTKATIILSNFILNEPKVFEHFIINFNKYKDYEIFVVFSFYTNMEENKENIENFLSDYQKEINPLLLDKLLHLRLIDGRKLLKKLIEMEDIRSINIFLNKFDYYLENSPHFIESILYQMHEHNRSGLLQKKIYDVKATYRKLYNNKHLIKFLPIIIQANNSYVTISMLKNNEIGIGYAWLRNKSKFGQLIKSIAEYKENLSKIINELNEVIPYFTLNKNNENMFVEDVSELRSILQTLKKQDLLDNSDEMQDILVNAIECEYILLIKLLINFELVTLEMFKNAAEEIDFENSKVVEEILEFTRNNLLYLKKSETYIETSLNNQIKKYLEENFGCKKEQEKNVYDINKNPENYTSIEVDYLVMHQLKNRDLEISYEKKILEERERDLEESVNLNK